MIKILSPWEMTNAGKVLNSFIASSIKTEYREEENRKKQQHESEIQKEIRELEERMRWLKYKEEHPHCTEMFLHFDLDDEIAVTSDWKIKGPQRMGGYCD